jgi:hypothetical protein
MSLLGLIIAIAVIGLLVWAIITYIPMPTGFKKAIVILAVVCIIIFILVALGLWNQAKAIQVPKL